MTGIVRGFADLLFPPKCLVCQDLGPRALCSRCLDGFLPVPPPVCTHCGTTVDARACRRCRSLPTEHLSGARSAGIFDGVLRKAIHRLKYDFRRNLAEPLGAYLGTYLARRPFRSVSFDIIVPIPLHESRRRERDFDQATLLAREVGRILSLPVADDCVIRTRRTQPQVGLDSAERARNVRGAFVVNDGAAVEGKKVLLIDDVATTLSTADACAQPIIAAGAKAVYAATLARDL